jgi:hypothetical protein
VQVATATSNKARHAHGHDHSHSHNHSHDHGHGHGGHAGPRAHTNPGDRPISNDPSAGPTRRYRESPYPMLPVEAALQVISEQVPSPEIISAPVNENLVGSVLAEDVTARESVPAFRASIVDGYAIIASKHVMVPSTIFKRKCSTHLVYSQRHWQQTPRRSHKESQQLLHLVLPRHLDVRCPMPVHSASPS